MRPIDFPEVNIVVAKDQPEYIPLPSRYDYSAGTVTFAWRLTWRERLALLFRGVLWHQVITAGQPLQPIILSVRKAELIP